VARKTRRRTSENWSRVRLPATTSAWVSKHPVVGVYLRYHLDCYSYCCCRWQIKTWRSSWSVSFASLSVVLWVWGSVVTCFWPFDREKLTRSWIFSFSGRKVSFRF
jgi:hypothetical protein